MRLQYPILHEKINGHPIVYLDSAATSLTPIRVQKAMMDFYNKYNANVHRSTSGLAMKATEQFENARKIIANFIGAKPQEIIFTRNTTEGLNITAKLLAEKLEEGDEILISIAEHHSNFVVWQQIAQRKKLELRFIHVEEDGMLDLEQAKDMLNEKTKLLAITHASNVLGIINPIKELTELAHKNGTLVVVDAAQTVGHIPVNVKELGVDFLAFSGHKMCGPTGIGVLYGDEELLEALPPYLYGGEMIERVSKEETSWNKLPWKYEAGTPNIAGAIGLAEAIKYLEEEGIEQIHEHVNTLTQYAMKRLNEIKNIEIYGTAKEKTGVVSFAINGINSLDIAALLDAKGIQIREGTHCAQPLMNFFNIKQLVRLSLYLYNTQEDIDFFMKSLQQIIITLGGKQ